MRESGNSPDRSLSVLEIRRGIARHRRALKALLDRQTFQGIPSSTAQHLAQRLEDDLRALESELGRRAMNVSGPIPPTDFPFPTDFG